jgi:hypothetical protein
MQHKPKLLRRRGKVIHNCKMYGIAHGLLKCNRLNRYEICATIILMSRDSQPDTSANTSAPRTSVPLRPLTVWLPDTRAPGFAAEARRQSRLVSKQGAADKFLELLEDELPWTDS